MMGFHFGGWAGWLAMSLTMLFLWGGLIAVAVLAVVESLRHRRAPEQVLAERFARGVITDDEFVRGRDVLTGAGTRS